MAEINTTTLLIRHLPGELSSEEKEDLLKHFGAANVRVMSEHGRMKHTAFATFPDGLSAKDALNRLHQLEILDCHLSAEFAKKSQASNFPTSINSEAKSEHKSTDSTSDSVDSKKATSNQESSRLQQVLREKDSVYTKLGIDYPRNPGLLYAYPSPTVAILTNIMHALAAHPRFYVQVLHLMNKLNIPAPFGPITLAPPVPPGESAVSVPITEVEMEVESSEESELESDEENQIRADKKDVDSREGLKRPRKNKHVKQPKKAKLIQPPLPGLPRLPDAPIVMTKDVFEQPTEQLAQKRIELKLPGSVSDLNIDVTGEQDVAVKEGTFAPSIETSQAADSEESQTTGFGKIEPVKPLPPEPEETNNEPIYDQSQFLTPKKLRAGQISKREWNKISAFKNYKSGDPTCRLYVKNVAKQITEQDLVNIFGGYAKLETEQGQNAFDVRLMKEGRMKGQAFVSFVSEESASNALHDTNGYLLNDKPIVVQFARSTKAK